LEQMEQLNQRVRQGVDEPVVIESNDEEEESVHSDETKINSLIEANNISEAFFLARRLVASGEEWAEAYLEKCRELM